MLFTGEHDRYFVCFSNGDVECGVPDEFERFVQLGDVHMVDFGENDGSYVVLLKYCGALWRNLPQDVRQVLFKRKI